MKYAIFDLEIIKAIPIKQEPLIEGIEYCAGWTDYANMGISVASFRRCDDDASAISLLHLSSIKDQIQLLRAQDYLIGGFNSRKFDDKLLQANSIDFVSDFDILEMILSAAGVAGTQYWLNGLKYNLDFVTQANGLQKTGHGALAPIWWQQGELQRVIDYCKNDVDIEYQVMNLLLSGELIDPNTNRKLLCDL